MRTFTAGCSSRRRRCVTAGIWPWNYKNPAEELDARAAAERRELLRRLTTLRGHLLKLRYQPRPGSERSRLLTVIRSRTEIDRRLPESPGLKGQLGQFVTQTYSDARRETGIQSGRSRREWEALFPELCPWPVELILDEDFLKPAELRARTCQSGKKAGFRSCSNVQGLFAGKRSNSNPVSSATSSRPSS